MAQDKIKEIIEIAVNTLGVEGAKDLEKALRSIGVTANDSDGKLSGLVDEMAKLEKVTGIAADFTRAQAALDKLDNEVAQAEAGIAALNREFDGSAKRTGEVGRAYKNAEKILSDLVKQQSAQRAELARTSSELKAAGVDTDRLADETARLDREAAKATQDLGAQAAALKANRDAAERNAKAFETLSKNVAAARGRLTEILQNFTKVTAAATAGAAALAAYGTGRFLASAISDAASFEHTIKGVAAAAGGAADDIQRLERAADDAGKGLGFTGQEGAEALQALARAGLDVDASIGALPATLALARAGAISVTESANRLADTLDQFGISGDLAAATADKIAKAAIESGTSVGQLTDALTSAAPTARGAGVSFETTAAALGLLAQNGIEGGKAGAALQQIFSQLQDPASAFSRALDEAGIKSRDFTTVIEALAKGGKGTKEAIQELGTRGTAALQALMRDGGGALRALAGDLQGAEGSAKRLAELFSDDVAIAFLDLNRAYEAARRSLLQPILEPLADELRALAGQIDEFAKSAEFERLKQQIVKVFTEGVDAAKRFAEEVDFSAVVAKIEGVAQSITGFIEDAKTYLDEIKVAIGLLDVAFESLQTGIFAVGAALAKAGEASARMLEIELSILALVPATNLAAKAIGGDLAGAAKKAGDAAIGMRGVYEEFAARTVTNANEARTAIDGVSQAIDANAASSQAAGQAAAERGQAEVAAATAGAAGNVAAAEQTTTAVGKVAISLQQAVNESMRLAKALQEATAGGATKEAIAALKAEFDAANAKVSQLEKSLKGVGSSATTASPPVQKLAQGVQQVAQNVDQASEASMRFQADFERAGYEVTQSTSNIVSILTALNSEFGATSESARQLFVAIYNGSVRGATAVRQVFDALQYAATETRLRIGEQQQSIAGAIEGYAALAEASDAALENTFQASQLGADGLRDMAQATRDGRGEFTLLNQADLSALADNIDRVAGRVDALTAKAAEARRAIDAFERAQQDAADRRAGNEAAIAEREFQDELARLAELERAGGESARASAERARALLRANHEAAMREIEAERVARAAAAREAGVPKRDSGNSSGGGGAAAASAPAATSGGLSVTINNSGVGTMTDDQLRDISRRLQEIMRRGR